MTSSDTPFDVQRRRVTYRAEAAVDDVLLRSEWLRLVRLAYVIVGDEAIAEELVQDTFVALHVHRRFVENPAGFLRTVLVNKCRSFTVRRRLERSTTATPASIVSPPDVDDTIELVRQLPPKYRTVLALRFYEDLSIDEIALVMGLRAGTVKSLLHRALGKLRAQMGNAHHEFKERKST